MQVEDKPPFFASWKKLYIFIACYLVVLVTLMYLFTLYYK